MLENSLCSALANCGFLTRWISVSFLQTPGQPSLIHLLHSMHADTRNIGISSYSYCTSVLLSASYFCCFLEQS